MGKPFSFRHRFFSRFHDVIISKIGRGCLVGAALRAVRPTLPTPLLVGAALRAVRIPTNMGVAQLASHSPLYPNSRMRPIFFISCGVCRSGHAGGVPLPANPSVGAARHSRRSAWLATNREPRLRGGYLRADRAKRTPRRGAPTNTASGRGGTPCRPHYLATAYNGRLGEASLPTPCPARFHAP